MEESGVRLMRYNEIAGRSIERLAALSDGLFAVAMTLLVLDLHAPARELIHSEQDLSAALLAIAPRAVVYLMSFMTLGIFWVGQQTQMNHLTGSDRNLTWIHLGFLLAVSLTPFSTALMGEFIGFRLALLLYWGNILLLGVMLFAGWRYARKAGLFKPDIPPGIGPWVEQRIVSSQSMYAFGALLCVFNTYWSLGVIVLVQLIYVFAPRWGFLRRL